MPTPEEASEEGGICQRKTRQSGNLSVQENVCKQPQQQAVHRGQWGSAFEFLVTSIGYAVGLGNVWRFPYKVYSNGGAVFLIPYTLALIFLAIPAQLLEYSIGQYSKKGPVGVWDMFPLFRGIGVATFYSAFLIYYNTPLSWACYYFVRSMSRIVPWSSCDASWAIHPCTDSVVQLDNGTSNATAAEMFFFQDNLRISSDLLDWGDFVWPLFLSTLVLWVLLFAGTSLGAASLGKVAYFTSLSPYVMLTVMVAYTATLPGAMKGINFYILTVDWSRLSDITVWRDAVAQVFFSTNCGQGASIQLASYNRYRHNILRDAILIPILDGATSIFAGFSVFTVLGFMAEIRGVEVRDVVSSGPGLIFITYAETFTQVTGGNIWSVFFFFTIIILGLSSQLPGVEMCCSLIADAFPWFNESRVRNLSLRVGFCLLGLAGSLLFVFRSGYYWYYLIDELVVPMTLIIIGLAELIGVGWFYSRPFCSSRSHKLLHDIEKMLGPLKFTRWFWIICWTFVAPLTLAAIFLYDTITLPPLKLLEYPWSVTEESGFYVLPQWSIHVGWIMVAISPTLMVIGGFWVVCFNYNGYKLVLLATKPSSWIGANSQIHSPCSAPKNQEHHVRFAKRQLSEIPLSKDNSFSSLPSELEPPSKRMDDGSAYYADNVAYAGDDVTTC